MWIEHSPQISVHRKAPRRSTTLPVHYPLLLSHTKRMIFADKVSPSSAHGLGTYSHLKHVSPSSAYSLGTQTNTFRIESQFQQIPLSHQMLSSIVSQIQQYHFHIKCILASNHKFNKYNAIHHSHIIYHSNILHIFNTFQSTH